METQINRLSKTKVIDNQSSDFLLIYYINIDIYYSMLLIAATAVTHIGLELWNGNYITNFRWLVEEDQTYPVVPGQTCHNGNMLIVRL